MTVKDRRRYAERTKVPVRKSKSDIEDVLERYGADQFIFGVTTGEARIMFRMNDRHIKFILPLPSGDDKEQRRRWRSLFLIVKAKLEAVATGLVEFEAEFMAQIVLPDGLTMAEHAGPMIEAAYKSGSMPPLLEDFRETP